MSNFMKHFQPIKCITKSILTLYIYNGINKLLKNNIIIIIKINYIIIIVY